METRCQTELGDRPDERSGGRSGRVPGDAVVGEAGRVAPFDIVEERRRARRISREQLALACQRGAERIGDRVVVDPETQRRHEHQVRERVWPNRRELEREHRSGRGGDERAGRRCRRGRRSPTRRRPSHGSRGGRRTDRIRCTRAGWAPPRGIDRPVRRGTDEPAGTRSVRAGTRPSGRRRASSITAVPPRKSTVRRPSRLLIPVLFPVLIGPAPISVMSPAPPSDDGPPRVRPLILEQVADLRQHLGGHQLGVVHRQLAAHVAELAQRHQMADVERRGELDDALGDLVGIAEHDVAGLDHVVERQAGLAEEPGGVRGRALGGLAGCSLDHALDPGTHRVGCLVSRGVGEPGVHVQAPVEEVLGRPAVEVAGLGLRVGNREELREPGLERVRFAPGLPHPLPEPLHRPQRRLVPEVREVEVHVPFACAPLPRVDRATTGDPHRWVRLLDGTRPAVDVTQLVMVSAEREDLLLGPRPQDQLDPLVVPLTQRRRVLPVRERGVHRRAHREAGDQPPARDAVEHRHLLGDAQRWVVERHRVAEQHDRRVGARSCQRRGDDVRARHQPVRVGVVLVDTDTVEPARSRVLELVDVVVVGRRARRRGRTGRDRCRPTPIGAPA